MSIEAGRSRPILYLTAAAVTVLLIISLYSEIEGLRWRALKKVSRESYRLGTIVRITAYGDDSEKLNNAVDLSMKEIERLENLLSVNIPSSDVSHVNGASGKIPVKVSEETAFLLEKALEWSERTGGAFDLTVGAIVKLWGIGTESAGIPDPEQLKEAVVMTDFKKVSVMHEGNEAFVKTAKGQSIDLGGIAKGYVTDRVREILAREGISSALIDLGGNIAVIGHPSKEKKWKIGLQDPFGTRGKYFGIVEVSDLSIVTSGPYERYFESGGVRYHHIFDTSTGYPSQSDLASVTIISGSSTDADALSTALFVMGSEKSRSFLREHKDIDAVLVAKRAGGNIAYVTEGLDGVFLLKDPGIKLDRAWR